MGEREEWGNATKDNSDQYTTWKEQVLNMSKEEFEAFLMKNADEFLNRTADNVFEEPPNKVVVENEGKRKRFRESRGEQ
jgi:hypothetical protein